MMYLMMKLLERLLLSDQPRRAGCGSADGAGPVFVEELEGDGGERGGEGDEGEGGLRAEVNLCGARSSWRRWRGDAFYGQTGP